MIYIETNSTKPQTNLAFEEYFLADKQIEDTIIMLWQNEPTVVVGAFQNTLEEVNMNFVETNKINVVRRITGGGAVYHDLGNLCFSFILKRNDFKNLDYGIFLKPVVKALASMGLNAEISGRNDLTYENMKISGNAMRILKDKLLFHGTLLYNSDLDVLSKALNVQADKIQSKAIKSVRSRVTNISEHLTIKQDILQFKNQLLKNFFENDCINEYKLSSKDLSEIGDLTTNRYNTFDWNFGKNPEANITYSKRFSNGKVTVHLTVKEQKILRCKFSGDFLGCMDIEPVENALINTIYEEKEISNALDGIDFSLHFGNISKSEIITCILGGV